MCDGKQPPRSIGRFCPSDVFFLIENPLAVFPFAVIKPGIDTAGHLVQNFIRKLSVLKVCVSGHSFPIYILLLRSYNYLLCWL